jgi:hypothetical protein
MNRWRRTLAAVMAVPLVILGLWSSLGALLLLVVFAEGTMSPRSCSPEKKARNRVEGRLYTAGALASFGSAAVVFWWGFHRRPVRRVAATDGEKESNKARSGS